MHRWCGEEFADLHGDTRGQDWHRYVTLLGAEWESGGKMRMSLMQHFALQSTTSNELQNQSHILDQALGMETLDGCWNLRVSHPFILLSLRSIYWHFTICLQCPRNWRSNHMLYSARYKLNKCIPRVTAKCKKTQTLTQSVQWEEVQNELSSVKKKKRWTLLAYTVTKLMSLGTLGGDSEPHFTLNTVSFSPLHCSVLWGANYFQKAPGGLVAPDLRFQLKSG